VGIASRQVVETHVSRYRQEASRFGFEDLEVYKAARAFRTRIYKLAQLATLKEEDALSLLKLLNDYISYLQRQKACEA